MAVLHIRVPAARALGGDRHPRSQIRSPDGTLFRHFPGNHLWLSDGARAGGDLRRLDRLLPGAPESALSADPRRPDRPQGRHRTAAAGVGGVRRGLQGAHRVSGFVVPDHRHYCPGHAHGTARDAGPGQVAAGLGLADLHQGPHAQRAAAVLRRPQDRHHACGDRRHHRRVRRRQQRSRLPGHGRQLRDQYAAHVRGPGRAVGPGAGPLRYPRGAGDVVDPLEHRARKNSLRASAFDGLSSGRVIG